MYFLLLLFPPPLPPEKKFVVHVPVSILRLLTCTHVVMRTNELFSRAFSLGIYIHEYMQKERSKPFAIYFFLSIRPTFATELPRLSCVQTQLI